MLVSDRVIRLAMLPIVLTSALLNQSGVNGIFPECLFKHYLGIECWGCGMTRAILELCKFNFNDAIALNPAAPLVLALISLIFFNEVFSKEN